MNIKFNRHHNRNHNAAMGHGYFAIIFMYVTEHGKDIFIFLLPVSENATSRDESMHGI
jgi:hypothetical protein